MMLCNDMSGGLPTAGGVGANGQSQCQMDAPPVSARTRDLLLEPATAADHRLPLTRPSPSLGESGLRKTVTPNSQSDWHLNFAENRSRNTENSADPRPEISDAMSLRTEKIAVNQSQMDVVLISPNSPAEARTAKRFANCMNSLTCTSSQIAKKRMRLDANPTMLSPDQVGQTNVLAQEHWKKGALGYLARDIHPSSSEFVSKEKVKISKDSLSQHLNHIDSLIVQHEMALARLHTTLEQLEEAMPKSGEDSRNHEKELGELEAKPQLSEAEQLLAENKRKAETSHAFMNKVKLPNESFVYQRPSDTAVYHENKHKFMVFKKRLVTFLKNRREAQNSRMEVLKKEYSNLHVAWRRKMKMMETDQKQSTKKVQEYFDKIFPEMKKQEEEKLQRYCSTVSPSTDSDGSSKDQKEAANKPEIRMEMVMEKLRSLAAQPPPLLDSHSRRLRFLNENGLIEEPTVVNSASMLKCSFWTEQERDLFIEKYTRHPKKFGVIASCLETKSIHDCVQFYYLTKKAVGYKKLQRQKYSRKPKMRGTNHAKEDKTEGKNSSIHPCRERLPLSVAVPTSAAEPEIQAELGQADEPLPTISTAIDVAEQVEEGRSSLPLEPSAQHPSDSPAESSLVSLNPPVSDEEKKNQPADIIEAAVQPLTTCDGLPAGALDGLDSAAKSSSRLQSPLHELQELAQDSRKAQDDDDSVATLSADEGATHSQDDDNCNPSEDVPTVLPSFPTQVTAVMEQPSQAQSLSSNRLFGRNDGYLSCPSQHDTEAVLQNIRPTIGKDGSRHEVSLATASPVLASDMRGFVKPASELDDRSKGMPDLLPLGVGLDARRSSPQVYSPSVGNQSIDDGRVVLPVAGSSSFVRNSGSPARIRDLIHAAIKKTLQVADRKPSEAEVNASRNDSKFQLCRDVAYQPPASCGSVAENEAEDLSVRHSRRVSSAAETSGKVIQPRNVSCQSAYVDSPYHLRPAHSNPPSSQPDPRSGYLLELAIVAEFENMKRSERDRQMNALEKDSSRKNTLDRDIRREAFGLDPRKETFERDPRKETFEQDQRKFAFERDHRQGAFERDGHSGRFDFTVAADPADQMLRRREPSTHKGSIMQGTPMPTSRFHAPSFHAEASVERFGVPSSSAGRNSGVLPEPPSSQVPFHATVPHISSEHMKLLCDDFQTAQQLRNMQKAPSGVERSDRDLTSYQRPYQGVGQTTVSGHGNPRMELYQPSKVGAFPGGIPNDLPVPHSWQHPPVRLSDSLPYTGDIPQGSSQRTLVGGQAVSGPSNHVMSMPLGSSSFETIRGGFLPDKRNSNSLVPSQWPIAPTAPASARFPKGSCLPEQKNWPKISDGCSAAQLIEWIISIQISQPDSAEKGIPASILNRIEETSAGPLPEPLGPWSTPPTTFRTRHDELRLARDIVSTTPRMAISERAAASGGRMSEQNFHPTAATSESAFLSRSEIPDRGFSSGAGNSDRVPGRGFPSGTGFSDQASGRGFSSGTGINDRVPDRGVPTGTGISDQVSDRGFSPGTGIRGRVSERGFSSGTGMSDRVLSSLMDVPNTTCLSGLHSSVSGHSVDRRDSDHSKSATTVESCMESIYMDMSRDSNSRSSTDANQIAMRTFLTGSDQTSHEDLHQKDVTRFNSRLSKILASSPWMSPATRQESSSSSSEHPLSKVPSSQRADSGSDDPGGGIDGVSCQEHLSRKQSTGGFNWKTKILREHQKQQRENEDRDSPSAASPSTKPGDHENKLNERQLMRRRSSSNLSSQSVGDTATTVNRPDDVACTASRLSSPVEGSRSVLGGVGAVQDDHESPIAGKHQMISTLLSSRSGRPSGRIVMPLSASSSSSSTCTSSTAAAAAAGPVPTDSQLSKQTVARDSKPDRTGHSPAPVGSESPDLDSPGLDMPGRLCIHLDSTEGLPSPSS